MTDPAFSASRCWAITDLHLEASQTEAEEAFFQIMERAVAENVPVVCGGDLFHLFLGWPGAQTPFQHRIHRRLQELRRRGLRFYWVEGNHDFYPSHWRGILAGWGRTVTWTMGIRRMAMIHGDRLNRRDIPGLIWLSLTKNPAVHGLGRLLPGPWILRAARRTERFLHSWNRRRTRRTPWNHVLRRLDHWAESRALDTVFVGHFHVWGRYARRTRNGGELVGWFLPAWEKGPVYAEINSHGDCRLYEADGTPLPEPPRALPPP